MPVKKVFAHGLGDKSSNRLQGGPSHHKKRYRHRPRPRPRLSAAAPDGKTLLLPGSAHPQGPGCKQSGRGCKSFGESAPGPPPDLEKKPTVRVKKLRVGIKSASNTTSSFAAGFRNGVVQVACLSMGVVGPGHVFTSQLSGQGFDVGPTGIIQ